MGYFDAMREGLYRQTLDGRRVIARRSILPWRKRWYYVTDNEKAAVEKRIIRLHVASFSLMMLLIALLGNRILTEPFLLAWLLIIAILPGLQSWTTSGLEPASIDERSLEPLNRRHRDVALARALGAPTLWFLVASGVVMASGQLYVIITDGAWWAWLGLAMFTAATLGMIRQLFLLREASVRTR